MAVVVPSRKRESLLRKHPLREYATILVQNDEVDAYRAACGRDLCVVGHNANGIAEIQTLMIAEAFRAGADFVVRTDDDAVSMRWMWSRGGYMKSVTDPVEWLAIYASTGVMALDAGIAVFGYNRSPKPMARSALQPFVLRDWITGNVVGVTTPHVQIPPGMKTCEDVAISLSSLEQCGMILVDQRWYAQTKTLGMGFDAGGVSRDRTIAQHEHDLGVLANRYPGVVVLLHGEYDRAGMLRMRVEIEK